MKEERGGFLASEETRASWERQEYLARMVPKDRLDPKEKKEWQERGCLVQLVNPDPRGSRVTSVCQALLDPRDPRASLGPPDCRVRGVTMGSQEFQGWWERGVYRGSPDEMAPQDCRDHPDPQGQRVPRV